MSICIKDQIQNMNIVIGCRAGGVYCDDGNNENGWHKHDACAEPEFLRGTLKKLEKKRP